MRRVYSHCLLKYIKNHFPYKYPANGMKTQKNVRKIVSELRRIAELVQTIKTLLNINNPKTNK